MLTDVHNDDSDWIQAASPLRQDFILVPNYENVKSNGPDIIFRY